ncbi:hypothetical protein M2432_001124 [Mycobacterium sp. OTB74]|nr:hypothetical protein [Mycobacterium sp. OTB74]
MVWIAVALGIATLTIWGNVEFWRLTHRRSPHRNDMSAFSDTIDHYESRPLIHPDGLAACRHAPDGASKIRDC